MTNVAAPRRKPAPRRPAPLSDRTAQSLLGGLLRRAEAGDAAAAGLLLRLHAEARQRRMLAALHHRADRLMAARTATAGGGATDAALDAELGAFGQANPDADLDALLGRSA